MPFCRHTVRPPHSCLGIPPKGGRALKDNIIVNSICEYIKDKIMSKEMFPGYRIVEDELASELGVSRTPLRRALAQLQYEGFLYIVPNRGTFVVQSSYEDIEKIYYARVCLEEGLAPVIIEQVSNSDIRDLEAMHAQFASVVHELSVPEYTVMNKDFHMRLAAISKNDYLIRYLEELHNRICILLVYYDGTLSYFLESLESHAAIIQALKERDTKALIEAVRNDARLSNYDSVRTRKAPQAFGK